MTSEIPNIDESQFKQVCVDAGNLISAWVVANKSDLCHADFMDCIEWAIMLSFKRQMIDDPEAIYAINTAEQFIKDLPEKKAETIWQKIINWPRRFLRL